MAYKVKVTRQGQTTIPKPLREKYKITEGNTILYIDVGDHVAVLPVPKDPLKVLAGLRIEGKGTVYDIRREALKIAQRLVEEKFKRKRLHRNRIGLTSGLRQKKGQAEARRQKRTRREKA